MEESESVDTRAEVLLVDDDPIVLDTLGRGLNDAGYGVQVCADAASALESYRASPPDVAVVDIRLPDLPGTDLATRCLDVVYRPIVILSGHADRQLVDQAIGSGVIAYLVKPIATHQLIPSIETACARFRRSRVQLASHLGAPAQSNPLQTVIDQFRFGIYVLGRGHEIIHLNRAAQALLKGGEYLTGVHGRLRAAAGSDRPRFEALVDEALGAGGERPPLAGAAMHIIGSAAGRGLFLWASPLRSLTADTSPCAVLVAVDPEQAATPPKRILRTLFGLTDKESELAQAILNGQTVEEYSRGHYVTPNTVRTHLKSIYRKTQTARQAELVRLLTPLNLHYVDQD